MFTDLPGIHQWLLTAGQGREIQVRFHWGSRTGWTGRCSSEGDTHLLVKCVGVVLTAGVDGRMSYIPGSGCDGNSVSSGFIFATRVLWRQYRTVGQVTEAVARESQGHTHLR